MPAKPISLKLTKDQLLEISAAIDSHIYWQLSDELYRNDGYVNDPGSDDEEAVEEINAFRKLQKRIDKLAGVEGEEV